MEDDLLTAAFVLMAAIATLAWYILPIAVLVTGLLIRKCKPSWKKVGVSMIVIACIAAVAITLIKFVMKLV